MTGVNAPLEAGSRNVASRLLATLVERCAPEITLLVYSPRIPDEPFIRLLAWSERLQSGDPWSAFHVDDLPALFGALNVALLSSWGYAPAPNQGRGVPPGRLDLELTDLGGAHLLERTRAIALVVAVAIHGDAGIALALQADDHFYRQLDAISAAIARRV